MNKSNQINATYLFSNGAAELGRRRQCCHEPPEQIVQTGGLRDAPEKPGERLHCIDSARRLANGLFHGQLQTVQVMLLQHEFHHRPLHQLAVGTRRVVLVGGQRAGQFGRHQLLQRRRRVAQQRAAGLARLAARVVALAHQTPALPVLGAHRDGAVEWTAAQTVLGVAQRTVGHWAHTLWLYTWDDI